MSTWRDFLEPELAHARTDTWITCDRCGQHKRIFSSAACNANTCESCLPDQPDPELQRLLREDAFNRAVNKPAKAGLPLKKGDVA
jgi:late competence protein required for DNA uptake (superfamily II DNA/RNA helicase)